MGRYATKKYVNYKLAESEWSGINRCTWDFQNEVINGGNGDAWDIYEPIHVVIAQQNLWSRQEYGTDGIEIAVADFKIEYMRLRIRCALGENETTSAVSQTVRVLIFRHDENWTSGMSPPSSVVDVDSMPLYPELFGDINGLYYDKTKYIHSWATDTDTTAGGQVFYNKLMKPKHSDVITQVSGGGAVTSEKGAIWLQILGDDPDGINASYYGYLEIGFRVRDS